MEEKASLVFSGGIFDVVKLNSSFDAGKIRVCYHGENRNGSVISKDTIEKATPSLYNCPIVCNYNIEDSTIGGHDVKVVTDGENMSMVNLTDAVGVVPSNATVCWEEIEDEDGVSREYLCADAILWKRSAAYEKIKSNGVTNQSMEISVFECKKRKDKKFEIEKFEFTALCLLGDEIEPCFESASLKVFSMDSLQGRMNEMMGEFKAEFAKVSTAGADDIQNNHLKGGNCKLNVDELMKQYNLSPEDINFELDGMEPGDIEEKLKEIAREKYADDTGAGETAPAPAAEPAADTENGTPDDDAEEEGEDGEEEEPAKRKKKYSLSAGDIYSALAEALIEKERGTGYLYIYEDHDDESVIYSAYNMRECGQSKFYKCPYFMSGDKATINFNSPVRQKRTFVDYDDKGVDGDAYAVYGIADRLVSLNKEYADYKLKVESQGIFDQFKDLEGNEMFEKLKEDVNSGNAGMTACDIEEKCFSIRGRVAKFDLDQSAKGAMRLPVEKFGAQADDANEPYGGVFLKYGIAGK